MAWCKFFFPKLALSNVEPGDPDVNEKISYAKCIRGHVLKDANDWICCENLPAPDAQCWKEGGATLFSSNPPAEIREEDAQAEVNKPAAQYLARSRKETRR